MFLERAGLLGAAALAGCLSDRPADRSSGGAPDDDAGEGATDTPTPSATEPVGTGEEPADTERSGTVAEPSEAEEPTGTDPPDSGEFSVEFDVHGVRSGSGANRATVAFGEGTVTVDGTIGGRNGCYTARLREAALSGDSLRVLVEAHEDRDEDELCTSALVDVDYVAAFDLEGPPPGRVVVEHDSMGDVRTVADERR